jgi:outer membrane protein OmpA-like peptidoglycan-associated protein
MPAAPAPSETDVPAVTPDLPADEQPLQPPPIRDTLKPSPALKPPAIDGQGQVIPVNHFVLPSDISTLPFELVSENIVNEVVPILDKLAALLAANGNVRITLTAYADNGANMSPRDARRLALARALVVRDYLTSKGISSGRIDVRALGANYFSGEGDRLDVTAN